MSLVCTRMSSVCHSYVLVCHPYALVCTHVIHISHRYLLYVTLFRMHVRGTAAEKEFDIAMEMKQEYVSSEIQENRNGRKR